MNRDSIDLANSISERKHPKVLTQDDFVRTLEANIAKMESDKEELESRIQDAKSRLGMIKGQVMEQEERLRVQRDAAHSNAMRDTDHTLWMVAECISAAPEKSMTATQLSLALATRFNIHIPASGMASKLMSKMELDGRFRIVRRDKRNYLYQLK